MNKSLIIVASISILAANTASAKIGDAWTYNESATYGNVATANAYGVASTHSRKGRTLSDIITGSLTYRAKLKEDGVKYEFLFSNLGSKNQPNNCDSTLIKENQKSFIVVDGEKLEAFASCQMIGHGNSSVLYEVLGTSKEFDFISNEFFSKSTVTINGIGFPTSGFISATNEVIRFIELLDGSFSST